MRRRDFLYSAGLGTLPVLLNGFKLQSSSDFGAFSIQNNTDRVLVLIQLQGGNDGLQTVVPLPSFDNLAKARENIIVPESSLLTTSSDFGFHPSMPEIANLYSNGYMHIVEGVAYPDQDRSHFRSTDIWSSASAPDSYVDSGWLGRYFELKDPSFPQGYPNEMKPHPFALTVGAQVTETCQGQLSNFSLAINDPSDLQSLDSSSVDNLPANKYGDAYRYISQSIEQLNAYGGVIRSAAASGNNLSTKYDENNALSQQLKVIAQLISGGLETSVYVVTLGGFDTHANQVEADDPSVGVHANLLRHLSSAIGAFMDDLSLLGIQDRVLGMTFSEFGRQIQSNASLGTDHGTAAPMMFFGSCINPGISGLLPVISEYIAPQEGVPMQYDFRSVYGTVLQQWFEVDEIETAAVLQFDFQQLDIFGDCQTTTTEDLEGIDPQSFLLFPNPVTTYVIVSYPETIGSLQNIQVFDHIGRLVTRQVSHIHQANAEVKLSVSNLRAGVYFVRCEYKSMSIVRQFVKV